MADKYISVDAVKDICVSLISNYDLYDREQAFCIAAINRVADTVEKALAADVVSKADYDELLKAARAMHTWIFLHSFDELEAYDECNLTPEMNALLGYAGSFEIRSKDND